MGMKVVFVTEDESYFFERAHHYTAKQMDSTIEICDELTRGETEVISEDYFKENFIIISDNEYTEYEGYVINGDTDLITPYLKKLFNKHHLNY